MDEQKVKKLIQEALDNSQYNQVGGYYHTHNGLDAPRIPLGNVQAASNAFCVGKISNGTYAVNLFTSNGASFNFTITGVFLVSSDTTSSNMTLKNNGTTVCIITKSTTPGVVTGATSVINTSYSAGSPISFSLSASGTTTVFMTFNTF